MTDQELKEMGKHWQNLLFLKIGLQREEYKRKECLNEKMAIMTIQVIDSN